MITTDRQCVVPGCDGDRGNRADCCDAHYQRVRSLGHPDVDRPIIRRQRGAPATCTVDGCDRKHQGHGYCSTHLWRLKVGDLRPDDPVIERAEYGTGYIDENGYRRIGKRKEHRMVMEAALGRPLEPDEHVHHRNGDRQDNRIENLELWVTRAQPPGQRVDERIDDAVQFLRKYAPSLLR